MTIPEAQADAFAATAPASLAEPPDPGAEPASGDLVIDGALAELAAVSPDDLDGLLRSGARVEDVLRTRLRDLST